MRHGRKVRVATARRRFFPRRRRLAFSALPHASTHRSPRRRGNSRTLAGWRLVEYPQASCTSSQIWRRRKSGCARASIDNHARRRALDARCLVSIGRCLGGSNGSIGAGGCVRLRRSPCCAAGTCPCSLRLCGIGRRNGRDFGGRGGGTTRRRPSGYQKRSRKAWGLD